MSVLLCVRILLNGMWFWLDWWSVECVCQFEYLGNLHWLLVKFFQGHQECVCRFEYLGNLQMQLLLMKFFQGHHTMTNELKPANAQETGVWVLLFRRYRYVISVSIVRSYLPVKWTLMHKKHMENYLSHYHSLSLTQFSLPLHICTYASMFTHAPMHTYNLRKVPGFQHR